MKKFMKTAVVVAMTLVLALGIAFATTGCGSNGAFKAAMEPTFPPFDTTDEESGELSGFDYELINAIAEDQNFEVEWENKGQSKSYSTRLVLEAGDRKGLLSDISRTCDELDIEIEGLNGKRTKDGGIRIILTLSITGTNQMQKVRRELKNIAGVIEVYRQNA